MGREEKIRCLQQGEVEKYGRVPPKSPVNIARRHSTATQSAGQQKPSETTPKIITTNK
jgi:hypothetical protein